MNLTGAPAHCWLLCLVYVCNLLNVSITCPWRPHPYSSFDQTSTWHQSLPPFSFWEPVYYKVDENEPDHRFASHSNEKRRHWVGFADNKGDRLTWKILTDETNQITTRPAVRSARKPLQTPGWTHHKGRINHKI